MAIKMKVGVTFGGKDETSKIFKRMGNSADKFGRRSKSAFDKASRSAKGFGRITKGILGAQLITGGLAKIRQGAGIISSQFLDFGDTITQAAVKFKDIGPKAGNFAEKLKEIKKEARGIAESTIFTAPQVAVAFKQLAQGGFKYETALKAMNGQIEFALATSEDFTLANKVSTKILGGFGLAVNDPIQKVKNLAFVNDILAKTVNNSSINLEQFFDAAKQIGPIARSLGSSLPEVASFVGVLGNSAIDASQAMTGLRNIFLRMSSPTTETARALKRIGLSLFDDQGKAKNMTQFLGELAEKVKGFSEKKRAGLFKDLFETRGIASAIILTDEINTGVKDFRTQIDGAKGEVAAMAKIMQNTLLSKIKLLQSASTELGFKFVEIFETKGRGLVAGSSVRTVLDLAGVADVTAKILSRSKNKLNNARAAMEALSKLEVERKP
ncbi:phage tail tape measure protein [Patescibacteria group bacterium]|nr:phage tail tape measure protein [Patescibacteria group bacterium]